MGNDVCDRFRVIHRAVKVGNTRKDVCAAVAQCEATFRVSWRSAIGELRQRGFGDSNGCQHFAIWRRLPRPPHIWLAYLDTNTTRHLRHVHGLACIAGMRTDFLDHALDGRASGAVAQLQALQVMDVVVMDVDLQL